MDGILNKRLYFAPTRSTPGVSAEIYKIWRYWRVWFSAEAFHPYSHYFFRIDRCCLIMKDGKRARQSHRQYFAFVLRPWFNMIPLHQALAWKKTCSTSYFNQYCMCQKAPATGRKGMLGHIVKCLRFCNGVANLELALGEAWSPQKSLGDYRKHRFDKTWRGSKITRP